MSILINVLSAVLGLLGALFVIGSQSQVGRIIIGIILIAAGIVRPKETTVLQKIDLTGDISTKEMKCKNCGGVLTSKSLSVKAGAIFVSCEYCGTSYQLEEAPKW